MSQQLGCGKIRFIILRSLAFLRSLSSPSLAFSVSALLTMQKELGLKNKQTKNTLF